MFTYAYIQPQTRFNVNAVSKLIGGAVLMVFVLLMPFEFPQAHLWLLLWCIFLLIISPPQVMRLFVPYLGMFLVVIIALPFHKHGSGDTEILQWHFFTIYHQGVLYALLLLIKAAVLLAYSLWMIYRTAYLEIIAALSKLRVPDWILAILLYVHRLFLLMQQELERMSRAMKSRNLRFKPFKHLPMLISFISVYFLRIFLRSQVAFRAMLSRGFSGKIRSEFPIRYGTCDFLFLLLVLANFTGLLLWL